jgi:hypothetical protein
VRAILGAIYSEGECPMQHSREQKRAELMQVAEAMVEEYLDWEEQTTEPTLSQIEAAVLKVRRQMSERMAEVAIADQDAIQPVETPLCPQCGERLRYKGQKARAIESLVGTLHIKRGYYHCAHCQSGLFPPPRAVGPTR